MILPPEKQKTLDAICYELEKVENVSSIVLGGSYATGRATSQSDLDIGIYYHEQHPFSINDIIKIATDFSIDNKSTVTDFYQWGSWVNGGAWIQTNAGKVDLLYRNINQVRRTIQESIEGKWENHYEQQPPYGFASIFYLAEIEACQPLFDPQNIIQYLKSLVKVYPEELKKKIIQDSLWSAEFTINAAQGYVSTQDYYSAFGCFTRTLKSLIQALFAINETYPISDKNAVDILEKSAICPPELKKRFKSILTARESLIDNLLQLRTLFSEIVVFSNHLYTPLFSIKN